MKPLLRSAKTRVAMLLFAMGLLGFMMRARSSATQSTGLTTGQMSFRISQRGIPSAGRAFNDTHGKVPGNAQNGIDDLKQFHRMIQIYRDDHQGSYPTTSKLMEAGYMNPQKYGFTSRQALMRCFTNEDNRYADNPGGRRSPDTTCLYVINDKRPDGNLVGTSKPAGTRDVLAYTDTYLHLNLRHFKGERSTVKPVGFYLVLWDDGQVGRISEQEKLLVPIGPNRFVYGFPGQAGVSPDSYTHDEFYRKSAWKKDPRNQPGAQDWLPYKKSN